MPERKPRSRARTSRISERRLAPDDIDVRSLREGAMNLARRTSDQPRGRRGVAHVCCCLWFGGNSVGVPYELSCETGAGDEPDQNRRLMLPHKVHLHSTSGNPSSVTLEQLSLVHHIARRRSRRAAVRIGSTPSGRERKQFSRLETDFFGEGGISGEETASACDVKGSYAPRVRTLGKRGDGTERDHHAGQDPA
jgi:hypothetical protein